MRKTLALSVVLLALAFLALPQPASAGIRFGLKGGVNMAKVTGTDAESMFEEGWKNNLAYCGGILLSFNFGNVLAIQPEVLYTLKGAKVDITDGDLTYVGKLQYQYIEIPLLLKLRLPLGFLTPFVFGGPSVGMKLGDAKFLISGDASSEETIEDFEKYDYGAVVGGGLELSRNLWLDVRYSTGLKKLIKDVDTGTYFDVKNAVLSATVSLVF